MSELSTATANSQIQTAVRNIAENIEPVICHDSGTAVYLGAEHMKVTYSGDVKKGYHTVIEYESDILRARFEVKMMDDDEHRVHSIEVKNRSLGTSWIVAELEHMMWLYNYIKHELEDRCGDP